ncbi:hypothetical protein DERF_002870 [Dermatophagoides farinae]|uniref:Uncharacterized protein n=1 Tax=Dermatophagoides farinae TaxID=6954 RepID=A0A922IF51_DERFA|nr:hypothetical protein DERF_002870 [Dermatophagoides farinae]
MDDDADDNNHHKGQTSTLVEYLLTAVYKTTMMLKSFKPNRSAKKKKNIHLTNYEYFSLWSLYDFLFLFKNVVYRSYGYVNNSLTINMRADNQIFKTFLTKQWENFFFLNHFHQSPTERKF